MASVDVYTNLYVFNFTIVVAQFKVGNYKFKEQIMITTELIWLHS